MKVIYDLTNYSPPGLLGYGYSAMAIDWADIGIQAQYPEEYGSTVKGKLGYGPLPGAKKYFDRKTNKWIEEQHNVDLLDFGGWDRASAEGFLKGVDDILNDPYAVTDLMIPGGSEYYNILDTHLNKVLSGSISPEKGCQLIYDDWVRITD